MSMILAAACHPEAQARVREELDLVVGRDRGQRIPIQCLLTADVPMV